MDCKSKFKNSPDFFCQWPDCACKTKDKQVSRYKSITKGYRNIGTIGEKFYKSSYEINFARILEYHRTTGIPFGIQNVVDLNAKGQLKIKPIYREIVVESWGYEDRKFWFDKARADKVKELYGRKLQGIKSGVVNYTPDFPVMAPSLAENTLFDETPRLTKIYFEVKGQLKTKDKTKLRRMRQYYPEIMISIIDSKFFKDKSLYYRSEIPEWE